MTVIRVTISSLENQRVILKFQAKKVRHNHKVIHKILYASVELIHVTPAYYANSLNLHVAYTK